MAYGLVFAAPSLWLVMQRLRCLRWALSRPLHCGRGCAALHARTRHCAFHGASLGLRCGRCKAVAVVMECRKSTLRRPWCLRRAPPRPLHCGRGSAINVDGQRASIADTPVSVGKDQPSTRLDPRVRASRHSPTRWHLRLEALCWLRSTFLVSNDGPSTALPDATAGLL